MGQYWSSAEEIPSENSEGIEFEYSAESLASAAPGHLELPSKLIEEAFQKDEIHDNVGELLPMDYEQVFLHNPVSMYLLSPKEDNYRIIGANYAYLAAINRTYDQIIGRHVFDVFPDNPDSFTSMTSAFRKSLECVTESKHELILPNAMHYDMKNSEGAFKERHWSIIIKPILKDGRIKFIMVKTVDVTETVFAKRATISEKLKADDLMKRVVEINTELMEKSQSLHSANENLKIINKQLEISMEAVKVSSKAKADFLANISHEMRTPLNAIIGFSELLDKDIQLTGNHHEFVRCISEAGHHLLGLINDLLDLAKMDAGKLSLNPQATNLVELFSNACALMAPKCKEKGLELKISVSADVPKQVLADALRVRQMIINLLSNAVKFTDRGFVALDVKVLQQTLDNVTVQVDVTDSGIGISELDQKGLFVRYEQVGTKNVAGGTGLGLPITKELVRLMGGDISVKSQRGVGSTFSITFSLPILKEVIEKSPDKTPASVLPEFAATPILLVDDIDMNRKVLRASLLQMGFTSIDEASDGVEAISMMKLKRYDLVLMDIFMPRMDGISAAKLIRAEPAFQKTRIFAVTASDLDESKVEELKRLFECILSKPLRLEQLQNELEVHCGIRFTMFSSRANVSHPMKLLLVDDHAAMRKLILITLSDFGLKVVQAESGEEALAKLKREKFDLVLIDRVMPGLNGFETVQLLQKESDYVPPVVMMSADITDEHREMAKKLGLRGILEKPIRQSVFRQILNSIIAEK